MEEIAETGGKGMTDNQATPGAGEGQRDGSPFTVDEHSRYLIRDDVSPTDHSRWNATSRKWETPTDRPTPPVEESPQVAGKDALRWLLGDEINGGFVRDLCYTVWGIAKAPNNEDEGASDYCNDTLPAIQAGVTHIRKRLAAWLAAETSRAEVLSLALSEKDGLWKASISSLVTANNRADAAETKLEQAKGALKYARHLDGCVCPDHGNPEECTCGLSALIERVDMASLGNPSGDGK